MIRRAAAIAAARAAAALSRRLRFGGGTALPGLVAQRIHPDIVRELAAGLGAGSVLVTGTNGKTTTARLLRNILQEAGLKPVANRAGSNMMRGIAAALAAGARWDGRFRSPQERIGVFEVDEATLPHAAAVRPRAVLFTNLFRDQLDRYGEVETVAAVWRAAAREFPPDVTLVLNADDPAVAALGDVAGGPVVFFGLADRAAAGQTLDHAADARWCSGCGAELAYAAVFYGHLGHWACPQCGRSRPQVQVAGTDLEVGGQAPPITSGGQAPPITSGGQAPPSTSGGQALSLTGRGEGGPAGLRLAITTPAGGLTVRLPLTGLYNAYNAVAAAAAATALGIGPPAIERGLGRFTAAFGRQERLVVSGREVQMFLAKNPAGLNQVLRTITANGLQKDIALFLNDNIADGRDVSWIWDVDFELLSGHTRSLTVSGSRAWDMALRLKYAGLGSPGDVEPDAALALRRALQRTPEGATLYVIPTYTAMLAVRNLLGRWAGRGAFWERD
ncbi:MAG: MurT ligase domain-containing protein [Dehalococcoidia bacterium]|nr:MurT ligase domain-containing protein [Dehalococcoidia bacterium]